MNSCTRRYTGLIFIFSIYSGCSSSPVIQNTGQEPTESPSTTNEQAKTSLDNTKAQTAESSLLNAANNSTRKKNYSQAIVVLERAIRLSPRDPDLWIRLSDGYLRQESLNLAEQYARKAIRLARGNIELQRSAWLQLANVLEKMGNRKDAHKLRKKYRYKTS